MLLLIKWAIGILLVVSFQLDILQTAPVPEKQNSSKRACNVKSDSKQHAIDSKQANNSAMNLIQLMKGIKKSDIQLSRDCHDDTGDGSGSGEAVSAVPGLEKKVNSTHGKKHEVSTIEEKEDSAKAKSLVSTAIAKEGNKSTDAMTGSTHDIVAKATDKSDEKGLASVFTNVDASKRNIPSHAVLNGTGGIHTQPSVSRAVKPRIHSPVKDSHLSDIINEEPIIKPEAHIASKVNHLLPNKPHLLRNETAGVQRSNHPSIVPSDESIARSAGTSSSRNSSKTTSEPVKSGQKGKVADSPQSSSSNSSPSSNSKTIATGPALQAAGHGKTASAKIDPYAEIAEGPDRPTLPELKTGNTDGEGASASKLLKSDGSATAAAADEAPPKPVAVPALKGKGSELQDVGGLLDRLTDKLNKGENIANEQPGPNGESKFLQDQVGEYENAAVSKEHQFDKDMASFNQGPGYENMQTSFDKESESPLSKDASPFEKDPAEFQQREPEFQKEPGFQKSNNWEDYNSILKSLDEEAKHGPGMSEYSYDEQNPYHQSPMGAGLPMPSENEGPAREEQDERSEAEAGARAAEQGNMGPYSPNSYTAAAVGAMESGPGYERQRDTGMNFFGGNNGGAQNELNAPEQSPFNGFSAPPGGGYGGPMMKKDLILRPDKVDKNVVNHGDSELYSDI